MTGAQLLAGRYEVLRTVSEGRRATVLQALDTVHGDLVALKVYPVTSGDRDDLMNEARLLMRIDGHRGLPKVRNDFFTDDGERFVVVMRWIEGVDLQQVLDDEGSPGLPLDDVIDDLAQVADALEHLHRHDPPIVHGDVKPANVIRAVDRRVVLVDFDIAGAHAGERLGTFGFVAPEVAAGEKLTPAADVYGLAATIVALLTGTSPRDAPPTFTGLDANEHGEVSRLVRSALLTEPARRPNSAVKLVESLRRARRATPPSGVVALLAVEVADAGRLWGRDADEMRSALSRVRDVRDEVVGRRGGFLAAAMNEGDRTITVFREASSAALSALDLHDRVAAEVLPPGFDLRLRAAIAVGEANAVDGVLTGPVVDQVVRLRAAAEPGTTVTSETTAELLVEIVGREMSIVPLGHAGPPDLPRGGTLFALTRPGTENSVSGRADGPAESRATAPRSEPLAPAPDGGEPTRTIVLMALQDPPTLTAVTVVGLAVIFRLVLAGELGMQLIGSLAIAIAAVVAVVLFSRSYSVRKQAVDADVEERRAAREAEIQDRELADERARTRARLEEGFASSSSGDARRGVRVLESLADEFEAVTDLLRRAAQRPMATVSTLLPGLADETYRHGMSALSNALELFDLSASLHRRGLDEELIEIEQRLAEDAYADARDRTRDDQRRTDRRHLLGRQHELHQHGCDLLLQAERCTSALTETRIELGALRAGDAQVDVDAVVQTLQETIRCVREVQDEVRRLGY